MAAFAARVETLRKAERIPGLAVVIVRNGTVIFAQGFGEADIARRVPVTPDTLFDIASVTKPMAAVVALRLAEKGRLDLDAPLASFAGFAAFCASVRAEGGLFFRDYGCDRHAITPRQTLSMTVNGIPGTKFFYNPPAYSWASRPMAQAAGTSFSDLMVAEVFAPAGMQDAARLHRQRPLPPALAGRMATPYHVDASGALVPSAAPPLQGDGAAGGVIASAMDVARFDMALTGGRLLAPASMQAMWTAGRAPHGTALPYGLGWYVQAFEGETLLWHSGRWEGAWSALYLRVPSRNLTLIALANSDGLAWEQRLDEAAVQRSPFVKAFLEVFSRTP